MWSGAIAIVALTRCPQWVNRGSGVKRGSKQFGFSLVAASAATERRMTNADGEVIVLSPKTAEFGFPAIVSVGLTMEPRPGQNCPVVLAGQYNTVARSALSLQEALELAVGQDEIL
jgi:hypothetical protein